MPKALTTEAFKQKAKEAHGNVYDYSGVNYANSLTKVKIICLIHGVFEQTPANHLFGQGCYRCGKDKSNVDKTLTTGVFIQKAILVHGQKYDYSQTTYTKSRQKTNIICPQHGTFKQTANDHLSGNGCPTCGHGLGGYQGRLIQEEFIERASNMHNHFYDYSLINYETAHQKVSIICPSHGVFKQTPSSHLYGECGCPQCANKGVYSLTYFDNYPEERDKEGLIYVVKVQYGDIIAIKIGVTKRDVHKRYTGTKDVNITSIAEYKTSLFSAFLLEQQTLNVFNDNRYRYRKLKPVFTGWTECFPYGCLMPIKNYIEEHMQ